MESKKEDYGGGITVALILIMVIAIILTWRLFPWATGFDGYNTISISQTSNGNSPPIISRTQQYQPGKRLWDWLQILMLPIVLTILGFYLNLTAKRNDQEIASDNQREAALQAYLDDMSELLLEKHLRASQPEDEVRTIARVRTLMVLPRLDAVRKRIVLQFLYESGLIDKGKPIIDLSEADLCGAALQGAALQEAHLCRADLKGANLNKAILDFAVLREANLSEAILKGAKVSPEQLEKAKSLRGAIMSDGSTHP